MIEIKGLTKSYGKRVVIDNLDGFFESGMVHGILGPNGCGKTTLIKLMLGLVHPQQGQVLFRGSPLSQQRELVSWLPQHPQAPAVTTPEKLFVLLEDLRGSKAEYKDALIEEFGFSSELQKPLSALSGGNYQKCFLIATLMFNSPLIVLDEPTVGLDPVAAAIFKKVLKARAGQATIILISHITSEIVQLSDKVHFLLEGKWAFHGLLADVRRQPHFTDFESFLVEALSGQGQKAWKSLKHS